MKQFWKYRYLFWVLMLTISFAVSPETAEAEMLEKIAAVVNEDVITRSDVENRMELVLSSANIQGQVEVRDRIKRQVLSQLVEETLRLQIMEEENIEVPENEVRAEVMDIAKRNKTSYEGFLSILEMQGINPNTLLRKIRTEIGWARFVQEKLGPQVRVSQADVENEMQALRENIGRSQFLVAEIFLPVQSPEEEDETEKLARQLLAQMVDKGESFPMLATRFSQSATAARGGDLGWIRQGQLNAKLDNVLQKMEPGQISPPVRDDDGYYIFYLRDVREIKEENLPPQRMIQNSIANERLQKLQDKYMLDLKSSAFIELRV